nr:immunoglobulin light chain junction region [Macaca mulatta]
CQHSYGIPFTF